MPKVSVITPVYNGEKYIESAINSLFNQSCNDWELIVVNDGSSDSTPQLLQKLAVNKKIKVLHQKNLGEACARNVGLSYATGEYIAFLDADDFYFPNALHDLVSFLDQHPKYDVVYSDGQICDCNDRPLMRLSEIRPGFYTGDILEQLVISSSVITVPVCTMARRSKVLEHAIQFDQNLVIGPDWDFWIQLAVYVKFGYLDKLTCKYRIHNTNITKMVDVKKRQKDLFFGRSKVMNSRWFADLSLDTRQIFFLDLLVNILSGNCELQAAVLNSEQFLKLPVHVRSHLWRMVGIDVLHTDPDKTHAKYYLLEAQKINPNDKKTRVILWSIGLGRLFTLGVIKAWRMLLHITKGPPSFGYIQSRRLQKMFGIR